MIMTYPEKVREKVSELLKDRLSPEKVVDSLTKDSMWIKSDIPTPKTIRNWLWKDKQKQLHLTKYQLASTKRHDIDIFKKSNDLMSEEKLLDFLWPLDGGPPIYYHDKADKVAQFLNFFSYEGNQYIDPMLKNMCKILCDSLTKLGTFLYHEFRTPDRIDHGDAKYSRLIPGELSHMHYSGEGDMEDDQRYWKYFEELKNLQANCQSCVKKYRASIRDLLYT